MEATKSQLTTRQQALAERTRQDARRAPTFGDRWLKLKDKKFSLGDASTSELKAVILDFVYENSYFQGAYNPSARQAPVCWAVGLDGATLAPGDEVPDRQNPSCQGCWADAYDSASRGKGKACKNSIRLGLLVVGSDGGHFPAFMRVPPASLRNFAEYADRTLRIAGVGLYEVLTTMTFDRSATYEKLALSGVSKVEDPNLREVIAIAATTSALRAKLLKGFEQEVEAEARRTSEDASRVAEIIGTDEPGAAQGVDEDLPF